ncbi:hypothetical protein ACFL6S_15085 [Candidatus Poribacteria bacterium]
MTNPKAYDGTEVVIWHEAESGEVYADGFEVKQSDHTIRVYGVPGDLKPDEDVNVKGVFHQEGHLTLVDMHIYRGRQTKIVVSVLPVLIVAGMLYRQYRFDSRKMVFRRKA